MRGGGPWLENVWPTLCQGLRGRCRYAPEWGYRYDGLYRIVDVLIDSSDPPSLPDYKKRRSTSSSRPHLDLAVRSQPSSDWRLPGRCVFKFIFAAIHGKHYQPPESSWRTSELPEMSGDLWKTRYRLQYAKKAFWAL